MPPALCLQLPAALGPKPDGQQQCLPVLHGMPGHGSSGRCEGMALRARRRSGQSALQRLTRTAPDSQDADWERKAQANGPSAGASPRLSKAAGSAAPAANGNIQDMSSWPGELRATCTRRAAGCARMGRLASAEAMCTEHEWNARQLVTLCRRG